MVILPETLETLGTAVFAGSRIEILCLPQRFAAEAVPYMRQFKDGHIQKPYTPPKVQIRVLGNPYCQIEEIFEYTQREAGQLPETFTPVEDVRQWRALLEMRKNG